MNSPGEYFVVFSNLAIIPSIVISIVEEKLGNASILTGNLVISTIYHLCQSDFFCIFETEIQGERNYRLLQDADQFQVSLTISWFVMYFLGIKTSYAATALFLLIPVFLLSVLSGTGSLHTIILVSIVLLIAGVLIYGVIKKNTVAFNLWYAIAASVLLITGFVFFVIGEDPGRHQYNTFHSLWHIFLMLAVFFVVLTKKDENVFIPLVSLYKSKIVFGKFT